MSEGTMISWNRDKVKRTVRVRAYMKHNTAHEFEARDMDHGREIAKRIVTEGLWVVESDHEVFFPITEVFKVIVAPLVEMNG